VSSLRIDLSDITRELFIRTVDEDGEEHLRAVVANTMDGRASISNYIEEFFDTETCSWCLEEVPDAELVEQPDGARICNECQKTVEHSPTHYCQYCGNGIYHEENVGWVDVVSGDLGGTYDQCPDPTRPDLPHVPGKQVH
jgi:hypothetical protein